MLEDENPPAGIILCAGKGREQIELLFLAGRQDKGCHKAVQAAQLKLEMKDEK